MSLQEGIVLLFSQGVNMETNFVLATWRLRTYLKLPWRPISIDGSTFYELDKKFTIVRHAESWNALHLKQLVRNSPPVLEGIMTSILYRPQEIKLLCGIISVLSVFGDIPIFLLGLLAVILTSKFCIQGHIKAELTYSQAVSRVFERFCTEDKVANANSGTEYYQEDNEANCPHALATTAPLLRWPCVNHRNGMMWRTLLNQATFLRFKLSRAMSTKGAVVAGASTSTTG